MRLTPARIDKHLIFRETFDSVKSVSDNGGVITGAPTINGSYNGGVTTCVEYKKRFSQYSAITLRWKGSINKTNWQSYSLLFGLSDNSAGYNGLYWGLGRNGAAGETIAMYIGSGSAYKTRPLAVDLTSNVVYDIVGVYDGTNITMYLNGVASNGSQSGAVTGATKAPAAQTFMFNSLSQTLYRVDQNCFEFEVYNTALTAEEVKDLYEQDTYSELEHPIIDLPLRSWYYNGSSVAVTENKGSLGGTVTLGNGSTTTTFPTQLSPHGFRCDSGDYFGSTIPQALGKDWTVAMLIEPTDMTLSTKFLLEIGAYTTDGILLNQYGTSLYVYWSTASPQISITNIFTTAKQTLIVACKDGVVTVFRNGVLFSTTDLSAVTGLSAGLAYRFGRSALGSPNTYREPKIYDKGLTPLQIRKLHRDMMANLNV